MEVRFHRLAIREYEDRRTWYESRREGLGDAFASEVDRAVARIAEVPESVARRVREVQESAPAALSLYLVLLRRRSDPSPGPGGRPRPASPGLLAAPALELSPGKQPSGAEDGDGATAWARHPPTGRTGSGGHPDRPRPDRPARAPAGRPTDGIGAGEMIAPARSVGLPGPLEVSPRGFKAVQPLRFPRSFVRFVSREGEGRGPALLHARRWGNNDGTFPGDGRRTPT